jgi:hypothetical protein
MLTHILLSLALVVVQVANAGPAFVAKPQTINLISRPVSKSPVIGRRALSSINVPLTDYFNGTDLQ